MSDNKEKNWYYTEPGNFGLIRIENPFPNRQLDYYFKELSFCHNLKFCYRNIFATLLIARLVFLCGI